MLSSDITDDYINGSITATLTGTITGLERGPGWVGINVDPGLPGQTVVQLRVTDADPIEFEATPGEPVLEPPGPSVDPVTGEPIEP